MVVWAFLASGHSRRATCPNTGTCGLRTTLHKVGQWGTSCVVTSDDGSCRGTKKRMIWNGFGYIVCVVPGMANGIALYLTHAATGDSMKTLLRALLIAILAIAPAMSQATTQTILVLNSQPGDYIGQGLQHTFRPPDGTFTVTTTYNSGIQVSFSGSGEFWTLDFGPPSALKFLPNEYEGAQRFPFHSPTRPGMDVSGDGRGCNRDIGRFLLSDIETALF